MTLTDPQKQEVRTMLEHPLMMLVMTEALRISWLKKKGAATLEEAAMAFNHQSGADDVLCELFSLVESKKQISITPRKLRHQIP